jgi:predicted dehydrogenase
VETTRIGIIGCGNISPAYLGTLKNQTAVQVVALADLDMAKAQARATEYGLRAVTVDELLADPSITVVLNLTIPAAHAPVAMNVLNAGKSVYNEKPLAVAREDGKAMLALAKQKKVRVGAAPDTFMGAGIQTCRKLIDEGAIGTPVAATAFMMCHGHESWHPAPEFYYKVGGGPMFDMGPYYLTALISLLGPVRRVCGSTRISFPTRTITSQPLAGTVVTVDVPTHIAGVMDFASGAVGTIVTSFDVHMSHLPLIEIYGSEGSLSVPDPNHFDGEVLYQKAGQQEWKKIPTDCFGCHGNGRGIGITDMAIAIRTRRPHRANGQMAFHVLDIIHAFHDSSDKGKHITLKSKCDRPAPMPAGLQEGEVFA